MFEEAEHLQLPEHPLAGNKVLEDIGHLFEGDPLPVSGVRHRPRGERRLAFLSHTDGISLLGEDFSLLLRSCRGAMASLAPDGPFPSGNSSPASGFYLDMADMGEAPGNDLSVSSLARPE